jgi:hypothetical protein
MRCWLCGQDDHNARRCPKNPKAGKKVNAHIKRAKTKNRREAESAQDAAPSSKRNKSTKAKVIILWHNCACNLDHNIVYKTSVLKQEPPRQTRASPATSVHLGPSQPPRSQGGASQAATS